MTSLTSGRFQLPLNLTEGNTIDFVFRLSNNGVLFTPALTPVWIFGIKDADTPNGSFLIQVNSATSASGVYTFVVELASAELQAWLATATSQSYAAIQITDSANDIATGPLLCQIEPNQNDSGTTPTSANGTLNVAATKTVTFPLSLTFPSAAGTNGFQLSTDGAGALTWTAAGGVTDTDKGDITVSNSGAQWTIDNDVVTLAKLAHMATARVVGRTTAGTGTPELLTISGTGSVAMTNTPTLVTPVLGAATGTSISVLDGVSVTGADGYLEAVGVNGFIEAIGTNAYVSSRTIKLFNGLLNTILAPSTATTDKTATFPNVTGTVAVATPSGTINLALFTTSTSGAPAYRAIASADIATALTTPGAIGGTTASTGAFTTSSLKGATSGVVTLAAPATATTATVTIAPAASVTMTLPSSSFTAARTDAAQTFTGTQTFAAITLPVNNVDYVPTLNLGGGKGIQASSNYVEVVNGSGYIVAFNSGDTIVNCNLAANPNNSRTCGTTGARWSNVFSVLGNFSGAVSCGSTLAVTNATTLTGGLNLGPQSGSLLTTTSGLTDHKVESGGATLTLGTQGPSVYGPGPIAWFSFNDANNGAVYFPVWGSPP